MRIAQRVHYIVYTIVRGFGGLSVGELLCKSLCINLGKVLKKIKKWLDLSNAHLTPASQAERWIKKNQKLHNFFMSLLSL